MKLLFITALEYTIRETQANQDKMKLNVTHQLLACTDDVQLIGKKIPTFKKSTEALLLLLLLLFIMHSSDPYKATSPLDIELVIG